MRCHVGGVGGITGKRIPGSIGNPELINKLAASRAIALFDRGSEPVEMRGDTVV
jgi:hypothetical protein